MKAETTKPRCPTCGKPFAPPGLRIRKAREAKGWTQAECAKRLHVSRQAVWLIERDCATKDRADLWVRLIEQED